MLNEILVVGIKAVKSKQMIRQFFMASVGISSSPFPFHDKIKGLHNHRVFFAFAFSLKLTVILSKLRAGELFLKREVGLFARKELPSSQLKNQLVTLL